MSQITSSKRPPPFSLWLSKDERSEIESRANNAGLSMGGYCKSVIFNTKPSRRSRRPSPDKAELAKLLGEIGRVGNNLNQVAYQLNAHGSVELEELKDALADLAEMRTAIMTALGYSENFSDNGLKRHDH